MKKSDNKKHCIVFVFIFLFNCLNLGCAVNKYVVAKKRGTIVFMGDSITQNWQILMPDFFSSNNYINKGMGGQTTTQMMARFNEDVLANHPHAVVLLGGTNDIAGLGGYIAVDSILKNIATMAARARECGIKVILCSVIPAYEYDCCKSVNPVPLIAALNDKLKTFAQKEGFIYVDYFSVLSDERKGLRAELTNDGVHPNKKGYELMRPLILRAIETVSR